MLLKLLLKIWPALVPIVIYLLWFLVFKKNFKRLDKNEIIDGEFQEIYNQKNQIRKEPSSNFSLKDPKFIAAVYLSLITAIICFLVFAITSTVKKSNNYEPAGLRGGDVTSDKLK